MYIYIYICDCVILYIYIYSSSFFNMLDFHSMMPWQHTFFGSVFMGNVSDGSWGSMNFELSFWLKNKTITQFWLDISNDLMIYKTMSNQFRKYFRNYDQSQHFTNFGCEQHHISDGVRWCDHQS